MSRSRYIRSHGTPGFAAYQDGLAGMVYTNLPDFGLAALRFTFRLDAMPTMLASVEEFHPLFSVVDVGVAPARDLLAIGVTPSGRIRAVNVGGDTLQTSINAIAADGVWHEVETAYDYGISSWYDLTDAGNTIVPGVPGTVVTPLLPSFYGRYVLFNGASGLTRCACSIADARATWSDALGTMSTTWDMLTFDSMGRLDVGAAGALKNVWLDGGTYDGALTLGWLDTSPNANPWGVIDNALDTRAHWSQGLQTVFTRRARAKTNFHRRRVAWLS